MHWHDRIVRRRPRARGSLTFDVAVTAGRVATPTLLQQYSSTFVVAPAEKSTFIHAMRASWPGPSDEAEGGTLYIRFVRRGVRGGARESTMIAVDERLAAESSGWVRSSLLAPGAGACGPAAQPLLTFVSAYEHLTPHALEQVFEAARAVDLLGRLDRTERVLLGLQQRHPAESPSDTDAASLHSERQSQLPAELALGRATRLREQVHTVAMACAVKQVRRDGSQAAKTEQDQRRPPEMASSMPLA